MTAIEVNDLNFTYGGKAILQHISMKVEKGSRICVVGANGAGKSTLLRVLGGLHMIPEQSVQIFGRSPFHDTLFCNNNISYLGEGWSRTVAFVGNDVPYSADITVADMLLNRGASGERIERLIKMLEVDRRWRMHEVSEGQRKRVMILMKMLKPVSVLLLDEVTAHLDLVARMRFLEYLRRESVTNGFTVLYATHIMDGLDQWPTHILHLRDGKVSHFSTFPVSIPLSIQPMETDNDGTKAVSKQRSPSSTLFAIVFKWLLEDYEEIYQKDDTGFSNNVQEYDSVYLQ